jgi:protein-disulfide isomerase
MLLAASAPGCSSRREPEAPTDTAPPGSSSLLPVETDDAVWGDPSAPVTIVAFLDFECPFCRVAYPTVLRLRDKYGPERLRFVFKHFPLPSHRRGINAARAAQVVSDLGGARAFFAYEHLLYDEKVDPDDFSPAKLGAWATEVGIPLEKFNAAYDSNVVRSEVWNDIQFAMTINVQAVPSFYINGLLLEGAVPLDHFESVIDGELKAAAVAREQGIPASRIYDRRIRANWRLTHTVDI